MTNHENNPFKVVVYISPLVNNLKFRGPENEGLLWNILEIKLILFDIDINVYLFHQIEELR